MFDFLKKKSPKTEIRNLKSEILTLKSLDCPSCAIDLDLTLEEIEGIISAKTNYAKSEIKISFDPKKITLQKIKSAIKNAGY